MAVNSLKPATQKTDASRTTASTPRDWARQVWKGVFSEGLKTTEVSHAQVPKALRAFKNPQLQIAHREGWVQEAASLPVKFEKGTFEGKAFYLVSIGAERMLYDASGKDLLGLMNPEPAPGSKAKGWQAD